MFSPISLSQNVKNHQKIYTKHCLKSDQDIGRKAVLSDVKTTCTPALIGVWLILEWSFLMVTTEFCSNIWNTISMYNDDDEEDEDKDDDDDDDDTDNNYIDNDIDNYYMIMMMMIIILILASYNNNLFKVRCTSKIKWTTSKAFPNCQKYSGHLVLYKIHTYIPLYISQKLATSANHCLHACHDLLYI